MSDYGVRRNRPARRMVLRLAAIFVVLVAAGVAFVVWSNNESRQRTLANSGSAIGAGATVGTPCGLGTPQGKLGRGDAWKTNVFNDVEYGRRAGDVDCGVEKDKGRSGFKSVCQFDAPAELRVVTKDGPLYFDVGLGEPATVVASDTGVACVKPGHGG